MRNRSRRCNKIAFPNNFFVVASELREFLGFHLTRIDFKPTIFWLAMQGLILLYFMLLSESLASKNEISSADNSQSTPTMQRDYKI